MAFDTFFGNENLKNSIYTAMKTDSLPHALILEGESGVGKRTFARLIAAALLCGAEEPPCGECIVCKNVLSGNHPDVLFFETEKHTRDNFKIETVRQIRDLAFISPNQANKKIFILSEADLMNASAQNALLKILEEPPAYAYFFLLCQRKSAFLETILSRCTVYRLERVDSETAVRAVEQLVSGPTREEIEKCVNLVGGNIGRILEGLKGNEAVRANEKAVEIAQAVVADYEFELLKALADFDAAGSKGLLVALCDPLKAVFRDALALRCGGEVSVRFNSQAAEALANRLTKKQLFALVEVSEQLKENLDRNMNQKLLITWLCQALRAAGEYTSGV